MALRDLIDSALSEVRLGAGTQRRERLPVAEFLAQIAVMANLDADARAIHLSTECADRSFAVDADPQLLASAVMNLLTNALKYTPAGGHVVVRAHDEHGRVLIEVEDECGGMAQADGDAFRAFGERRGRDRSGLGLGLSIARKAITAHEGDIHVRNMPGKGCVFVVDMPMAQDEMADPDTIF
jgi:signal transduction histidine kinase